MDPLISAPELARSLGSVALYDARSGPQIETRFAQSHLAGARHVHLERDLSDPGLDAAHGGRHPLPSVSQFAATLGRLGIEPHTDVVIYDDKGGANAAGRFWWMLRAAGHTKARVLDGGMAAAITAGVPIESGPGVRVSAAAPYPFTAWQRPTLRVDEFAAAIDDGTQLAIDVRSPARFRGEEDAFDPNPGHVPGTLNVHYEENLNAEGLFQSAQQLRDRYEELFAGRSADRVVIQCGSGVTACHTLLALERAGLDGARLYVGSFSEWTRQGRPVTRGQ